MTLHQLLALPPGGLDKAAARAMGWREHKPGVWQAAADCWYATGEYRPGMPRYWTPSTDYNDAALLRYECGRRNCYTSFTNALARIVGCTFDAESYWDDLGLVADASPRQVTAAAVATLEGS